MIDVRHEINSVSRRVGSRTLDVGEVRVVTITRTYPTTIDDLWDACTDPGRIARWFLPVTGELRLGGHYQLEGNAGGTIEGCDPPNSFEATWEYGGGVSWIALRLTPEGDHTRFELDHIAPVDEHWLEYGPGAVGVGWDLGLLGLGLHLASEDGRIDRDAVQQWTVSDEGKDFMRATSEQWRDASVAAGTPANEAKGAAERTIAAYTGE